MTSQTIEVCDRKCANCTTHWFLNVTIIAGTKDIFHYTTNEKTIVLFIKNNLLKLIKRTQGVK